MDPFRCRPVVVLCLSMGLSFGSVAVGVFPELRRVIMIGDDDRLADAGFRGGRSGEYVEVFADALGVSQ